MSQNYEQFGKYLLLEKVAAGGMAEIYLARSGAANGLNKFFAIKRILPQYSTNDEFVAMFKEEAKVAINLNHNNVVSIYDFGVEASQFFLVMDYVEGRNLRQIINELKKTNKSFTIDQALYLIKETAAGLDHAHRCTDSTTGRPLNITHRDMSPQNIMVSFEGEVKVIDFGIAKAETDGEQTKAGTLKGKFSYMSPEQAEGQPIDPRTDVFALGIVLWELLANDRLFTGSNEAAILRKVRDCQIPPIRKINPTVPQELERIVMKALAKDRNVRYQTAANFHRDLNRFLNTQYPEFSPQDFSIFVRECFKTAYQDGREKLIGYSKAKVSENETTQPRSPKVTIAETAPPTPDKMAFAPAVPEPLPPESNIDEPRLEPNGFSSEEPVAKINLDGLRSAASGYNSIKGNPNLNSMYSRASSSNTSVTGILNQTQKSNYKKSRSGDGLEVIVKLALVAGLAYGGWWGYKNYYTSLPVKPNTTVTVKPKDPKNTGVINSASTAPVEVKVSVNSNPDNADIFVNGTDSGIKTPAVMSFLANKEIEIVIRKNGYLEYKITRTFNEVSQVIATMQASLSTAYLNIRVTDGNSFTKISINGKELLEKPPILKYPIVALKDTVITAYNPISKLKDEKTVTVSTGEAMDVQLTLDKHPNQK